MTISHLDPAQDADQHLEKVVSFTEATAAAERAMSFAMLETMLRCDANAPAFFAPVVPDYQKDADGKFAKLQRVPRLWECMHESLDYGNGPTMRDLMALLLKLAHTDESQKEAAKDLLQAMAGSFSMYHAEAAV